MEVVALTRAPRLTHRARLEGCAWAALGPYARSRVLKYVIPAPTNITTEATSARTSPTCGKSLHSVAGDEPGTKTVTFWNEPEKNMIVQPSVIAADPKT